MSIIDQYSAIAAEFYGADRNDVLKRTRQREVVDSRMFLFFALVLNYKIKPCIIEKITGFDHSTVLHAINAFINRYQTDKDVKSFADSVFGVAKMKEYINETKKRKRKGLS